MKPTRDSRLLQAIVPAVTVATDGCAGEEQAPVPDEAEALEAALRNLVKAEGGLEMGYTASPLHFVSLARGTLTRIVVANRIKASAGGNAESSNSRP